RAVRPPETSESSKKRTFVILGSDESATSYVKSKGLKTSNHLVNLNPDENMVIIWNTDKLTAEEKRSAQSLCDFASSGGLVVVLSTKSWNWRELCDVTVDKSKLFSRAFAYEGVQHPILAGIHREWLMRWNGLPGTVAVATIEGPGLENAENIIWARDPNSTVVAEVPTANGKGKILFSQLDIQNHLDSPKPNYDPVAERILLNMLGQ
nr:hypothetical protein [bacterium]